MEQININETAIRSENEEYKFEKSVIASGAFSKKFTDQLGENIPEQPEGNDMDESSQEEE